MSEKNQMHVHKKRENPLSIEPKSKVSSNTAHDFLKQKKSLKTHGLNVLVLNKDIKQALKSLQPEVPFSLVVEEALLKYLEALSPNEYKNLVRLLKERG
jgi:SpoU rRNA methylase family enzyme